MICDCDKELLKLYLIRALGELHRESIRYDTPIEAASIEGAIGELELLWIEMFQESPPSRDDILKKEIIN